MPAAEHSYFFHFVFLLIVYYKHILSNIKYHNTVAIIFTKGRCILELKESLICTKCRGSHFTVKRVATYLYSYDLENKKSEALPFLFDNRELVESHEYLQCEQCGATFPCTLDERSNTINFTIEQKAVRSDHVTNPEFLG